jgi:hypothetical protein
MTADGATRTDPVAGLEAAHRRYADLEAQAAEAADAGHVAGTPEGDRAFELDHDAGVAYEEYLDAWHALESAPEPQPEAEPEMEAEL